MYKGFRASTFDLIQNRFPVPVKQYPSWYRKTEQYIKGFSRLLPEGFNWYSKSDLLSVRYCVRFVQPKQANNLGTVGKVKEGSNPDRT
ncbi:hypothetical protein BH23CYA1_BH23CYA1_00810 [soil metagenome]